MVPPRISRKPSELAQQLMDASVGIGNEALWSATAITATQCLTARDNILNTLSEINNAEGALKVLRGKLAGFVDVGRDDMGQVDSQTDVLYTPTGNQKANFGVPPYKATNTASTAPDQLVIQSITDGTHPASLFVDFDSADQAAYEVQWFSDAPLTVQVGSQTVTASEHEITGLVRGQQYWVRVRAVRAGQAGPWSDQATRVANI